ncbi:MAG: hypothetical protein R2706_07775 [Acidimicrobiales bacterium]
MTPEVTNIVNRVPADVSDFTAGSGLAWLGEKGDYIGRLAIYVGGGRRPVVRL